MYAQKQPAKSKQNPSKQNEKVSSNVNISGIKGGGGSEVIYNLFYTIFLNFQTTFSSHIDYIVFFLF